MTSMNFIAVSICVVFFVVIVGIRLYKNRNTEINLDDFVDMYGDNIIQALQDAILILMIEMGNFETREEYEKAIINETIVALKKSASRFGIPDSVISLIDTDSLTRIIADCFNSNKFDCLSALNQNVLEIHKNIVDPEVLMMSRNSTSPN